MIVHPSTKQALTKVFCCLCSNLRYLRNDGKKVFWSELAGAWLINSWLVLRLTITKGTNTVNTNVT